MRRNTGFTAIELMVVIAIAAILAALALPSFDQMIKKWQMKQELNALVDTIYFARSEAIKRGGGVQMVKLLPCTGGVTEWSCGWRVQFEDSGGNVQIIKDVSANQKNNIYASVGTITLDRWGNRTGGFSVHVTHKRAGSDLTLDQYLCVSAGGRLKQADTCTGS